MRDNIAILVGLIVGLAIGVWICGNVWERTSVKAGKAEYYLDENNNKQWRWK